MKKKPSIAVVLYAKNAEETLEHSVRSLLDKQVNQVVVVDAASTDRTQLTAQRLSDEYLNVYYVYTEVQGKVSVFCEALEKVATDYVMMMETGDELQAIWPFVLYADSKQLDVLSTYLGNSQLLWQKEDWILNHTLSNKLYRTAFVRHISSVEHELAFQYEVQQKAQHKAFLDQIMVETHAAVHVPSYREWQEYLKWLEVKADERLWHRYYTTDLEAFLGNADLSPYAVQQLTQDLIKDAYQWGPNVRLACIHSYREWKKARHTYKEVVTSKQPNVVTAEINDQQLFLPEGIWSAIVTETSYDVFDQSLPLQEGQVVFFTKEGIGALNDQVWPLEECQWYLHHQQLIQEPMTQSSQATIHKERLSTNGEVLLLEGKQHYTYVQECLDLATLTPDDYALYRIEGGKRVPVEVEGLPVECGRSVYKKSPAIAHHYHKWQILYYDWVRHCSLNTQLVLLNLEDVSWVDALIQAAPETLEFVYVGHQTVPSQVKRVAPESVEHYKMAGQAATIISDKSMPSWYHKRDGQVEIRLFPEVFTACEGFDDPAYKYAVGAVQKELRRQVKHWDNVLTPSAEMNQWVTQAYDYHGAFLPCGFPLASDIHRVTHQQPVILYMAKHNSLPIEDLIKACPNSVFLMKVDESQALQAKHWEHLPQVYDVSWVKKISTLWSVADAVVTDGQVDTSLAEQLKIPVYIYPHVKDTYRGRYVQPTGTVCADGQMLSQQLQQVSVKDKQVEMANVFEALWAWRFGEDVNVQPMEPMIKPYLRQKLHLRQVYQFVFKMIGHLPRRQLMMFESFYGKKYSDNPKALYQYAKAHYPEYDLMWSVPKEAIPVFEEAGIPYSVKNSVRDLWLQARAKYWIVNTRQPLWKQPPKGTTLIQTWHGTPLKTLGVDIKHVTMPGTTTEKYHHNFLTDTQKWTYLIAPNEYSNRIFQSAFDKKVPSLINSGYPRNDILYQYDDALIERLKRQLHLPLDKKVILYAPTWRDNENHGQGNYYLTLKLDLDKVLEAHPDCVILIRAHYLIAQQLDLTAYGNRVINVSDYQDINDLYLVSDVLITDYSSVFFDYANLRRPMIFFAYDYEAYGAETRGFYFDYETVPGPIVKTTDEVNQALSDAFERDTLYPGYEAFLDKYCRWEDGNASKRVFDMVMTPLTYQPLVEPYTKHPLIFNGLGDLWSEMPALDTAKKLCSLDDYAGISVMPMETGMLEDPLQHVCTGERYYKVKVIDHRDESLTKEIEGWVSASAFENHL